MGTKSASSSSTRLLDQRDGGRQVIDGADARKHRAPVAGALAALAFMTGLLIGVPCAGASTIRHVSPAGTDVGDCATHACRTIGYTIRHAQAGDTIEIAAGIYYPHVQVDRSLTLVGAGTKSTILDGAGNGRVVTVGSGSASLDVTLAGLTVRNGRAQEGGGVASVPGPSGTNTVNLARVLITGNAAVRGGGVFNAGTLTVTKSTIDVNRAVGNAGPMTDRSAQGGGIFNSGTLLLSATTVSGNRAQGGVGCVRGCSIPGGTGWGGGLYDSGRTTLVNSTISANVAQGGGTYAGMGGGAFGGGIEALGTETMVNVTIAANHVFPGGGPHAKPGRGSGGGLDAGGSIGTVNAIIAGNTAPHTPNCSGRVESGGHNIVGMGAVCSGFTASGDRVDTDPMLGPLQKNGGATFTMAIPAESPAVDAGDQAVCTAAPVNGRDQRGVVRPQGAGCDIGAFELESSH